MAGNTVVYKAGLELTADVSQAKKSIEGLQEQLSNLSKNAGANKSLGLTKDLQQSVNKANELKSVLTTATMDNGQLDLSKFNQAMKQSGSNLATYRNELSKLGPEGQQAFQKVTSSILTADKQMKSTSKILDSLVANLNKVAMWQISSAVIHGLQSGLNDAFRYAKNLNESLTNIQIVTQQSSEQMAQFAEQANKAAQSLSTTTTAYTDAALIYYQQGLTGKDVTDRTDATIKMAQATGDSATEVSSYMTAIWNNFDDGSESLEHYADVITALGASTASSSSEIAEGLEKFASIGSTVGLSYEYATSALATVVAQTRQSADTVGTAFKTLFARIQDLELGDEGSVSLGKYAQALEKVGVNILDEKGNMKEMDIILDEMGAKWDTLNKQQQTALAQNVAGTRQYTQLVALMENYDQFKQNLNTANDSEGTLQAQAEIYEKSWKASSDRVKSSLEELYSTLINDDFFISLNDGIAKAVSGVTDLVEAFGGVKGIVITIVHLLNKQLAMGAINAAKMVKNSVSSTLGLGNQKLINEAKQESQKDIDQTKDATQKASKTNAAQSKIDFQEAKVNNPYMSEASKNKALQIIEDIDAINEEIAALQKKKDITTSVANESEERIQAEIEKRQQSIEALDKECESLMKKRDLANAIGDTEKAEEAQKAWNKADAKRNNLEDKNIIARNTALIHSSDDFQTTIGQAQSAKELSLLASGAKEDLKNIGDNSKLKEFQSTLENIDSLLKGIHKRADEKSFFTLDDGVDVKDRIKELELLLSKLKEIDPEVDNVEEALKEAYMAAGETNNIPSSIKTAVEGVVDELEAIAQQAQEAIDKEIDTAYSGDETAREIINEGAEGGSAEFQSDVLLQRQNRLREELGATLQSAKKRFVAAADGASKLTAGIASLTMAYSSLKTISDTYHDSSLSGMEKLETMLPSLAMGVASLTTGFTSLVGAVKAFSVALNLTSVPMMAIAAATGALLLVGSAMVVLHDNTTEAQKELNQLKKETESLAEASDSVVQKLNEVENAFSAYKTAQENIEACVKGTEEYETALKNAATASKDLLKVLPSGQGLYEFDEEIGQFKINEAKVQEYLNTLEEQSQLFDLAEIKAGFKENTASAKADADYMSQKVGMGSGESGIGNILYDNASQLAGLTGDNLKTALENLGVYADFSTEQMDYLAKNITKLADTIASAETDISNANKSIVNQVLGEDANNYSGAAKAIASNKFDADQETAREEYTQVFGQLNKNAGLSQTVSVDETTGAETSLEDYWRQVVQEKLGDNFGALNGFDDEGNIEYYDANNELQTITAQTITELLALSDAVQNVGQNTKDAENILNSSAFSDKGKDFASNYLEDGAKDALSGYSKYDLNQIKKELSNVELNEDGTINKDTWSDKLTDEIGLTSEAFQLLGVPLEDFQSDIISASDGLIEWIDKLPVFDKANATGDSAIEYGEAKNAFSEKLAQAGATAFGGGVYEKGSSSEPVYSMDSIINDNKENTEGLTKFFEGFDASMSLEEYQQLVEECGLVGDAVAALGLTLDELPEHFNTAVSGIKENQATLDDVFKDKGYGDTISKSDMENVTPILESAGVDLEKYFTTLSNGSAMLTGNAEEFLKIVQEYDINQYKNALAEVRSATLNALAENPGADATRAFNQNSTEVTVQDVNAMSDLISSTDYSEYLTPEQQSIINSIKEGTAEAIDYIPELNEMLGSLNTYCDSIVVSVLNASNSLEQLKNNASDLGVGFDFEGYSNALMNLGYQYTSCSDEVRAYDYAIKNLSETEQEAKRIQLETAIAAEEAAEQYGVDANLIEDLSDNFLKLADSGDEAYATIKKDAEGAKDAAVRYVKLNDAIADIYDNYDDYASILREVNDAQDENSKALVACNKNWSSLKKSLAGVLDVSEDMVDTRILDGLSESDLKAIAEGGDEAQAAIGRLRDKFIELEMTDLGFTQEEISALQESLNGLSEGQEISLDNTPLLEALIEAEIAAGCTEAELQTKLSGFGIDCDTVQFITDLNEATAAAEEAGSMIIDSLSTDAETVEADSTQTETKENTGFVENVAVNSISRTDQVLEADGKGAKTVPVTQSITYFTKSVEPNKVTETDTKENKVVAVKLKNAHKSAGGKVSSSNSPAGRAASGSGRRSSGGSGSRGGRGSGSGSGRTARNNRQESKTLKDEKERYHVVNNQLEDLNSNLDTLSKAKDRAFGKSKIKLIDQEIDKQKELIETTKKYANEVKAYYKEDQKAIQDLGATFDKNGTITNYDALISSWVDEYNKAVATFNSKTTDDEDAKEVFEAAEKLYEERTKVLQQYEETQDLWKEVQQQVTDAENDYYDKLLERTQYVLELQIEVDERDLELINYFFDKIADRAFEAANKIELLTEKTTDYVDKLNAYEGAISEILSTHGYDGDEIIKNLLNGSMSANQLIEQIGSDGSFTQDEVSQISDGLSNVLSVLKDLQTVKDEFFNSLQTEFNDWIDSMDSTKEKVEALQSTMEHYLNLVDLIGKNKIGMTTKELIALNQKALDVSKTQVKNAREEFEAAQYMLSETKKQRDEYISSQSESLYTEVLAGTLSQEAYDEAIAESQDYWKKLIDEQEESVNDLQDNYLTTWEETLEKAKDLFDKAVEQISADFSEAMAGNAYSLEALQNAYNQTQTTHSTYVDDYERIYQLSKLTRTIEQSIDNTDNVRAKQMLAELTEEIVGYQEKGAKISQYEIEYLQKEYDLKMAQIALEEAQNAKSEVSYARDSEGNYGYVYTANADQVNDAEQNYRDKLYEMEVLNAEYINSMQEQLIQIQLDYQSAFEGLGDLYTIGSEEYNEALEKLNEEYRQYFTDTCSELDLVLENNTKTYEVHAARYAELTGEKEFIDQEYLASFEETQFAIKTGYGSLEEVLDNFIKNTGDLYDAGVINNEAYADNVEEICESAGVSVEDLADTIEDSFDTISDEAQDLSDTMTNSLQDSENAWDSLMNKVDAFESNYGTVIDNILSKNEALVKSFNELLSKWAGVEAYEKQYNTQDPEEAAESKKQSGGGSSGSGKSSSSNKTGLSDGELAKRVAAAIWVWNGSGSGWGNGSERVTKLTQKFGSAIAGQVQAILNSSADSLTYLYGWNDLKSYFYSKFDTGGYTGAWGPEGRMAMLHEKEIVLNKEDTENFLSAIDMVRQISNSIDINALSSSLGRGYLRASSIEGSQETFEQTVTINPIFNNCDRNEIVEAFSNMTNLAAQYANRKI